jgi:uncharacterized membrane protein YccF (DUF307 family)
LWRDRERTETIPLGIAAFRIGIFALSLSATRRSSAATGAIGDIVTGLLLGVAIIGIPFDIANFKLIPVSLFPLGRENVTTDRLFASR